MKKEITTLALAIMLGLGNAGVMNAYAEGEGNTSSNNYFPSEGFEDMLSEGEESYELTTTQRNSVGSLDVDSHAYAKRESNGNVYLELMCDGTKAFSSFFAMMDGIEEGDYNVSVDFQKGAGWTDTDNLGFRFYNAGDSLGWASQINDAAAGEWVTLTETYTVGIGNVVDSFQLWFNTMSTNVLMVDNVTITKVKAAESAPEVTANAAKWLEESPSDVVFEIDLKGEDLISVTNVAQDIVLTEGSDYSLNDDNTRLTFFSNYLADFDEGAYQFDIQTNGGTVSVVITIVAQKGQIPSSTDGYELVDTLLGGTFEDYEVGLTFSESQTDEAWGSTSYDDPGIIYDDDGNHVVKLARLEGSTKTYSSCFAMTSPDIQLGDIVTVQFSYKLVNEAGAEISSTNFCFVGASNTSYHTVSLDNSNHATTEGASDNVWDITYTEDDNGYVNVEFSFIVDFAFLNSTNSIRFLYQINNDTDYMLIDNVRIIRWVDVEAAEAEVPTVSPSAATFDADSPSDLSFTVDLKDYTLSSLKLGDEIISSSNYTITNDTILTIRKDYLATLSNGDYEFTITTLGGTATFTITVQGSVNSGTGGSSSLFWPVLGGVIGVVAVAAIVVVVVLVVKKKNKSKK